MNLTRTAAQKHADRLEMEATRFAAHLSALTLRESNSAGRLARLQRVNARAHKRAERRYQKSL
jgi:hypothetical protein